MDPFIEDIAGGARPTLDQYVEALGRRFPLLHELAATPQDPEWHAEGDVHIHTSMVLDQIYQQLDAPGATARWSDEDRLALILGAVFHDIAKPISTRTKEINDRERIVAPRHAELGRSYIAFKLMGLGMPYSLVRKVMGLVGHHHDPKWLVIKDKPARKYRWLARMADIKLLYALEVADLKGRICPDLDDQLDQIELYRLEAEDHDVWDQADPYAAWREQIHDALQDQSPDFRDLAMACAIRDAEAGLIYTPDEAIARSYRFREGFGRLVIMCGPSGSGKSSWIDEHLSGYEVLSLDQIREELTGDATDQSANSRVRQVARDRLKPLLQYHKDVVWDATNLRADFRSAIIQIGMDYGAMVSVVALQCSEETCMARNQQRERTVPPKIVQHQLDHTQWPSEDEAHRTLYIDDQGEILHASSELARQAFTKGQ